MLSVCPDLKLVGLVTHIIRWRMRSKPCNFCLLWGMFVLRMIAIVGPDVTMF